MAPMAYIQLAEGLKLSVDNPQPDQIPSIPTTVRALGREHRFSNQSDKDWTGLDHSLHVWRLLATTIQSTKGSRRLGLGHDLSEGIMRDLASPYKRNAPGYKTQERLLMQRAIVPKFGLQATPFEKAQVQWADTQALAIEAVYCLGLGEVDLADWGFVQDESFEPLTWPEILRQVAYLEYFFGRADFRAQAPTTFLKLAEEEGFLC